jgi:hypothetical protein
MRPVLAALALTVTLGSYLALAQQQPAGGRGGAQQAPAQPMSFFVTSVGKNDGANYGGLTGADAHCQALAKAAGRGDVKWVAYLSTQGPGAVNARDRIGNGPWYNARGQMIAANQAELHGGKGQVQVGHHDKIGGGNGSWNSAHGSRGCAQPNLVQTGGAGLLYCFAPGN